MDNITIDSTNPIAVEAVHILFKLMDSPVLLLFIIIVPLLFIMLLVYKYEKKKSERIRIIKENGIEETYEVLLWVVTGKNKPNIIKEVM